MCCFILILFKYFISIVSFGPCDWITTTNEMFHYRVTIKFTKGLILKDKFTISGTPIPEFVGAVENVTVPVGRDAIFTCNVKNLGRFKVRGYQFHQHFTSKSYKYLSMEFFSQKLEN